MRWLAVAVICQAGLAWAEDELFRLPPDPLIEGARREDSIAAHREDFLAATVEEHSHQWTIDYRVRSMFNSHASYEFGTPPFDLWGPQYAPLSRLDWPLDGVWHGLRIGIERPQWDVSFEWLTPMEREIHGQMADFDWYESDLDNLSYSPQRWTDGQMLDLAGDFQLTDALFAWPIEIWPMAGVRFQRFNIMAHDTENVYPDFYPIPGDVCSFNQQYYIAYLGGQLRTTLETPVTRHPILLTFQGDWGATWGYNIDHHLTYEEMGVHRYTMEKTSGGAMHLAFTAETPLGRYLSLGVQADHTAIHTTGTHHWVMSGAQSVDETWRNGVVVKSDQTSITAFLRVNF
jgi:hypothetical protein